LKKYIRWPVWIVLATLFVAAVMVIAPFLHSNRLQKAHASGTAAIKLGSTILTANTPVKVTGTGFNPYDYASIYIDNSNSVFANSIQIDDSGNFSAKVTLPTGIPQGKHILFVQDSAIIVQTPVTFKPRIIGVAGKSGLAAQFSGGSFAANETVSIYWGTNSTGISEGTAAANATGDLTFSFNAPNNLTNGTYPVTVIRTNQKPAEITTPFKVIPVAMISTPGIRLGQKSINVQLSGFLPNDMVDISWSANGGQSIGTLYTDSKGATGKATFWPQPTPLGAYTLTASDSSGLTVTNSINVGPGINFWGNSMVPNQSLYVTGGGFTPGEVVKVYFANPQNGVVTTTTDATGAFSATVTTPSSYDPSKIYYVYAKSTSNSEQARSKYTPELPQVFAHDVYYNEQITEVTGVGFGVGETVDAIWGYQQPGQKTIGSAVADSNGFVSFVLIEPSVPVRNLTIALVGRTSHFAPTITVLNNPALLLDPTTGTAGTTIHISGGNFGANDTISIAEQGTVVTQVTSQSDGSFTATLTAPPDLNRGDLVIAATDAAANVTASTTFSYPPQIAISPSTVHFGDTIVITGQHFAANTGVDIYTPQYGTSRPQHWATSDANGSFTISIVLNNSEFGSGVDTVYASDTIVAIMVSTTFTIQ
jgi:hypothetical protein